MKWEAVLLAGGKLEEKFIQALPGEKAPGKAYLSLNGKRMVDYVTQALQSLPQIRRIVSVVPEGAPGLQGTDSVAGGESLILSLAAGFDALSPGTELALVSTSDIPCVSVEGMADFIRRCEDEGGDAGLYYSMVSREVSERKFPGIPHTYVRLREGRLCGGGLFAVAPGHFPALRKLAEVATRNRKNVLALARIFGVSFIIRFLLHKLSVSDLEKRGGELLGFRAKGILSPYPEIAFNVDDPAALKLASSFLKNRNGENTDGLKQPG